jgi:hypothetical protein
VKGANQKHILRGRGTFELSFEIVKPGYPHVSFYPLEPPRDGIGGVYVGEGEFLLKHGSGYERLDGLDRRPGAVGRYR